MAGIEEQMFYGGTGMYGVGADAGFPAPEEQYPGHEDYSGGPYAEADAEAPQAEASGPTEKEAGNACVKTGDFARALEHYTIALTDPTCDNQFKAVVLANRSMCYFKLEDFDHAVEDAEQAFALDPAYSKALTRKANALDGLKKYKEAVMAYETVLKMEPGNKPAQTQLSDLARKLASLSCCRWSEAFDCVDVLQADSDHCRRSGDPALIARAVISNECIKTLEAHIKQQKQKAKDARKWANQARAQQEAEVDTKGAGGEDAAELDRSAIDETAASGGPATTQYILEMLRLRAEARDAREFKKADTIRRDLSARGITVDDNTGTWTHSDGRTGEVPAPAPAPAPALGARGGRGGKGGKAARGGGAPPVRGGGAPLPMRGGGGGAPVRGRGGPARGGGGAARHDLPSIEHIESLCKERKAAKMRRQFELADELRDQLTEIGVTVDDRRKTWSDSYGRTGRIPFADMDDDQQAAGGAPAPEWDPAPPAQRRRVDEVPPIRGRGGAPAPVRGGRGGAPAVRGRGGASAAMGGGMDEVRGLLSDLGLEYYLPTFEEQGMDNMAMLRQSSLEDFEYCGVKPMHARKIMQAAQQTC